MWHEHQLKLQEHAKMHAVDDKYEGKNGEESVYAIKQRETKEEWARDERKDDVGEDLWRRGGGR